MPRIAEEVSRSVERAERINRNSPVTSTVASKPKEPSTKVRGSSNYWLIYVLKLQHGCWYVGKTTVWAYGKRMKDHWSGRASKWTNLHRPVKPHSIEVLPRSLTGSEAEFYENSRTLKLAREIGSDFVRGGGYTQVVCEPSWPKDV